MEHSRVVGPVLERIETPCFVCDVEALENNLRTLADVQTRSGAKILLALKGFAQWSLFPLIRRFLAGAAASSPHEAQLAREEFGGEVHAYAPAYSDADLREICRFADHVVFNSVAQWQRHRSVASGAGLECGLRLNPEHSEVPVALYDPCAASSRLGVTERALAGVDLSGLDGAHFHTLCELGSDALERTWNAVEARFGRHLTQLRWFNMGGGHHITRAGYDRERLVNLVQRVTEQYGVQVYLEPGEAIALGTGVLVTTVLDIVDNGMRTAILDTSATAHMPDVLEMPYRAEIVGAAGPGVCAHTYRLGGLTCLAGDVVGDYSFDRPLEVGQKLVLLDMAHYTMVKTTTFNGVRLPSIASYDPRTDDLRVVRRFGYEDYRGRLS
ncbi:MAG: carboxynorspermidine decarboxylase [Myxococcales bacterium FL481]|nr:MAG: carboxynorspermidine decarboxylase [Myxococcales bacterium FL481]